RQHAANPCYLLPSRVYLELRCIAGTCGAGAALQQHSDISGHRQTHAATGAERARYSRISEFLNLMNCSICAALVTYGTIPFRQIWNAHLLARFKLTRILQIDLPLHLAAMTKTRWPACSTISRAMPCRETGPSFHL